MSWTSSRSLRPSSGDCRQSQAPATGTPVPPAAGNDPSHHRADLPGDELVVAIAELLRLGALARGDGNHFLEDFAALFLDADAVEDVAAVDVHVLFLAAEGIVVGGELDRRRGL